MSVQSNTWHRECYKNAQQSIQKMIDRLNGELIAANSSKANNEFYYLQILEAESRGKPGFDRDRFLVGKKA